MLFVNENRSNRLLLDKNTNIPRIRIKKTEIRRIRGRSRIRKELRSEQRGGKEEKKEIESELAKGNLFHALLEHTRSIYPKSLQRSLQLPSELPCCNHVAPRLLGTLIKERIGLHSSAVCGRKEMRLFGFRAWEQVPRLHNRYTQRLLEPFEPWRKPPLSRTKIVKSCAEGVILHPRWSNPTGNEWIPTGKAKLKDQGEKKVLEEKGKRTIVSAPTNHEFAGRIGFGVSFLLALRDSLQVSMNLSSCFASAFNASRI